MSHTPPSDGNSGFSFQSSQVLARRLSKSLHSSRFYSSNSLLAELADQIDPQSMYDDIMHSNLNIDEENELDDENDDTHDTDNGAKRRQSISRSNSAEDSISELSQMQLKASQVCLVSIFVVFVCGFLLLCIFVFVFHFP